MAAARAKQSVYKARIQGTIGSINGDSRARQRVRMGDQAVGELARGRTLYVEAQDNGSLSSTYRDADERGMTVAEVEARRIAERRARQHRN